MSTELLTRAVFELYLRIINIINYYYIVIRIYEINLTKDLFFLFNLKLNLRLSPFVFLS